MPCVDSSYVRQARKRRDDVVILVVTMTRDHTARTRICQLLVSSGPVVDPSGYATAKLKESVDYEGSSVAFIQLIAAMDRAGELTRDIRGKRTYAIAATAATLEAVESHAPSRSRPPMATLPDYPGISFDHEAFASALVREIVEVMPSILGGHDFELIDERDYASRLDTARARVTELLAEVGGAGNSTK